MALRLALDWRIKQIKETNEEFEGGVKEFPIFIPKKTYVSVPAQIKQAGFSVKFTEQDWKGMYELYPSSIYDCARRFTSGMFPLAHNTCTYLCVSFHYTKILGLGHGGAILHDDPRATVFFQKMRHDGRMDGHPIDDSIVNVLGHHCPMAPEIAAAGLVKLASLPRFNEDLPNSDYTDLSTFKVFK